MRLSDIMSRMSLEVYPQIALVIFAGVFVLIVGRILRRGARAELERAALIPLAEEPPARPAPATGADRKDLA